MAWNKFTVQEWTREIPKAYCKKEDFENFFATALSEPEGQPDPIMEFDDELEARIMLQSYDGKSRIVDMGTYYRFIAYAIECWEADEDGEFINGSDYICAEGWTDER